MSKSILIDDIEVTRSAYALNLTTYVGTEIVDRKGPRDTIDLLEVLSDFDLIITKQTIRGKNAPSMIQEYLKSKNLTIPMIILGQKETEEDIPYIHYLTPPIQVKDLIDLSSKVLGVVLSEVAEKKVVTEYIPVPINYFLLMKKSPCEIFIRINDTGGPKYIKRIHDNDDISRTVILKYQDSGVKNLYIHSDFRFSFTDSFTSNLISKLEDESLTITERIEVSEDAMEFAHKELREIGINENLMKVSNSAMKSMIKTVKSSPKLADMLSLLQKNSNGHMYKHCVMLNLVSCSIIQKINWATYEFMEKMSYVSFFHDIALTNPEWSKIHSIDDFNKLENEISASDRKNIMDHALKSSEIVGEQDGVPMGVAQIIKQHHGVLNGRGFTSSFAHNMAPLTIVFIVAEHFVDSVLSKGEKGFNKQKLQEFYSTDGKLPSSFEKTLEAFERAFD